MRTTYLSDAKIKLANALDNKDTLTCENWIEVAESVLNDIRMTTLFARNTTPKGLFFTTNMSEGQVRETAQFKRIAALAAGEGCTLNVTPDLYKYIRWILKRENITARYRTIKLGDDLLSVSRIA